VIHYEYIEPTSGTDFTPVVISRTREEILAEYYPYWAERMARAGRATELTAERCLEDWCVIHWAARRDEPMTTEYQPRAGGKPTNDSADSTCPGALRGGRESGSTIALHCAGCAETAQLRAQLAQLTKERDQADLAAAQWVFAWKDTYAKAQAMQAQLAQRTAALQALVGQCEPTGQLHPSYLSIPVSAVDQARRALAALPDAPKGEP
jgi:hypothetical protein